MDRFAARHGRCLLPLLLAAVLCAAAGGCANVLATGVYLIKGNNAPAEFDGLKKKKVAVVCRPPASLEFSNANAAPELAKQVGQLLSINVSKIIVIDPQEIADWTDENLSEDYVEIGHAVEADMVVGIDLEDFRLFQGQTLYQGRANVRIRVYDLADNDRVVFEKIPPQHIYPPNTGIPTQDKQEAEFRRQYIGILAEQVGRLFYAHDAQADFALDSTSLD